MSREIKFRAWLKEPKIMAEVKGSTTLENKIPYGRGRFVTEKLVKVVQNEKINALWWCYERDDGEETECEIMQFTGLRDCKGREIYESDIIKIDDYIGGDDETDSVNLLEVRFVFGKFIADLPGQFGDLDLTEINKTCEVVGNIYQNPELLGE